MARGINKVILVGNCGNDPELRYMPDGKAVANLSIATSEAWKDKQTGEQQERTEWHRVVFFGKIAEIVGQYVRKGGKLYIEGKLQTRKWTDQQSIEHYSTEVLVDINGTMQILDSKQDQASQPQNRPQQQGAQQNQQAQTPPPYDDFDDDIPF